MIWKNRKVILEGIKAIAADRLSVCKKCDLFDATGDSCVMPGTQPCCGECGCSLALKTRSLSSECAEGHWTSVLTDEEDINHEELNPEQDD